MLRCSLHTRSAACNGCPRLQHHPNACRVAAVGRLGYYVSGEASLYCAGKFGSQRNSLTTHPESVQIPPHIAPRPHLNMCSTARGTYQSQCARMLHANGQVDVLRHIERAAQIIPYRVFFTMLAKGRESRCPPQLHALWARRIHVADLFTTP